MQDQHITSRPLSAVDHLASAVDHLANDLMDRLNQLDPASAIINGFLGYPHNFRDYSPQGSQRHRELYADVLEQLAKLPEGDATDRITRSALQERLGLEIEIIDSGLVLLNNIATPAHEIRNIFDLLPAETKDDWQRITDFLMAVPAALEGFQQSLLHSARYALAPALRQVDVVAEQIQAYIAEDGFFQQILIDFQADPFDSDSSSVDNLRIQLQRSVETARAAYSDFQQFLKTELSTVARDDDAVGPEFYSLMSRYFLGAEVDLQETYEWGVAELDRIVAEQQFLAAKYLPANITERTVAALRDHFSNDPERQINGTTALQTWMQQLADQAVKELGKEHFDIPAPVQKIECMIAPTQEGGIYYTGPSDDFSRPGRMWWSVPAGNEEFSTWIEKTTVYHEGVPGHHLQIGLATYFKDTLNDWRRHGCWVSGHGEGWALYAEELMYELGYMNDPADHLGMLDAQRLRAARVVFDIGLHLGLLQPEHYGGEIWNAENGFHFLQKHLNSSPGEIHFEWLRYLGWPGQAPSYKIGQRVWETIRAERERLQGEKFNLKAFHTQALSLGSIGLETLREALGEVQ